MSQIGLQKIGDLFVVVPFIDPTDRASAFFANPTVSDANSNLLELELLLLLLPLRSFSHFVGGYPAQDIIKYFAQSHFPIIIARR